MPSRPHAAILLVLALCLPAASLWLPAQTTGGALQGKVTDEGGQAIAGALIEVRGPALQAYLGTATDLDGQYKLPFVPAGKAYEVQASADGFNKVVRKGIEVPLGMTVDLPFTLGQGKSDIVVTAPSPTVDVKSATSGSSIPDSMIATLPLARDYTELAYLVPTAVDGGPSTPSDPSIGGSTGAENNYLINGVDVTNERWGTNGASLNFDFIQEMQVLTGGMPPEYGATMGGVVNAITRSGGNEFHGSAFAYYWSDKTMAKYAATPRFWAGMGNDGFQRYDAGATLGGYFVKDKLWFYVAYDYNDFKEYTNIPRDPEYGDDYLYLDGQPAQSCFAGHRFCDNNHVNQMVAFKLTWNAGPNQKVALSVFGNDWREHGIADLATLSLVSATYEDKAYAYNVALQWNATWSPKFFSELDLGYRHGSDDPAIDPRAKADYYYQYKYGGFEALPKDNTVAPVWVNGSKTELGHNYEACDGWGSLVASKEESWQGRLKLTNLFSGAGRHELSYGLQFLKSDYSGDSSFSGPPIVSPLTHLPVTGVFSVQWWPGQAGPHGERYRYRAMTLLSPSHKPASERFGVGWVNDDWTLTDHFTLKLGLRYDQERFSGVSTGSSITLTGNWAPRLGFTWDVMHDGKSKLYGFAGRYFERVPLEPALLVLNRESHGYFWYYDPKMTLWTGQSYVLGGGDYIQGQDIPPASQLTPALAAAYAHKLKAPYTDEWILGYQYQAKPDLTLGARLIYRDLGRALDDLSYDGGDTFVLANPEYWTHVPVPSVEYPGTILYYPDPVRRYEALELTLDKRYSHDWQLSASLVYSKLKGNYEGVANNDYGGNYNPNINPVYDIADTLINAYGLLPLDRPYVMKAYGSYAFTDFPLLLSAVLKIQSGTPISKKIYPGFGYYIFAAPRGSCGRTPWTWTLDLGIQYDFKLPMKSDLALRVDIFNATNEQKPTAVNQVWAHQNYVHGPLQLNEYYGDAVSYQTPRRVRFALRWAF